MSETKSPHSGLTRRSFLKATSAIGASAICMSAASGCAAIAGNELAGVANAKETDSDTTIEKSVVCQINCGLQNCGMIAHVRDGNLVKTSVAKDDHPHWDRRPCLRGRSHVQWIYHPDRIKFPMKRLEGTERGAGQWERISWEEAIDLIVARFKALRGEFGDGCVVMPNLTGTYSSVNGFMGGILRFQNVTGITPMDFSLDYAAACGYSRVFFGANAAVTNSEGSQPWAMLNARTVLLWGINMPESRPQYWHWVMDAKEKGARIVSVDVRYTTQSAKADENVFLNPGTDTALVLSMMNVILENEWYDLDFITKYTVAPFLVKESDGQFLKASDFSGDISETAATGTSASGVPVVGFSAEDLAGGDLAVSDPYLVYDQDRDAFAPVDVAANPVLTGSFNANGISVVPAFSLLKNLISQYPPSTAAEITGVSEEQIVGLARAFAKEGPVYICSLYGFDRYDNGDLTAQALCVLSALVGNIGKPGASVGSAAGAVSQNFAYTAPTKPGPGLPLLCFPDVVKTGKLGAMDFPVKAMFSMAANPIANCADANEFKNEVLPLLDFVVTHDSIMSDTAQYSDVVLPAAHWFEVDDMQSPACAPFFQINEKCIEPLYEAKSNIEVLSLIADGLGYGEYFQYTPDDYMKMALDSDELRALGITLEALKEKKRLYAMNEGLVDTNWPTRQFPSPSGRLEIYQPNVVKRIDWGQEFDPTTRQLPYYQEPLEAGAGSELAGSYPLNCIQEHGRWRVHTTFGKLPILRELSPEPIIYLARSDAEARGIVDEDIVRVFNDRGEVVIKAIIDDGLPSGLVNLPKGWEADDFISGNYQNLTKRYINPIVISEPFCECRVQVERVEV